MTYRVKIILFSTIGVLSGFIIFLLLYKRKSITKEVLTWIEPISGRLTSPFGSRTHPVTGKISFHNGIDLAAPNGTPIKAPMSGVVEKLWTDDKSGNAINIKHNDNLISGYAHLSKFNVTKGQSVKRGDVIGFVGSTGMSTGNHLHFVVKVKNKQDAWDYVNPINYIKQA